MARITKNMLAKKIAMNVSIIMGPKNIQGTGPQSLHHNMALLLILQTYRLRHCY